MRHYNICCYFHLNTQSNEFVTVFSNSHLGKILWAMESEGRIANSEKCG